MSVNLRPEPNVETVDTSITLGELRLAGVKV